MAMQRHFSHDLPDDVTTLVDALNEEVNQRQLAHIRQQQAARQHKRRQAEIAKSNHETPPHHSHHNLTCVDCWRCGTGKEEVRYLRQVLKGETEALKAAKALEGNEKLRGQTLASSLVAQRDRVKLLRHKEKVKGCTSEFLQRQTQC